MNLKTLIQPARKTLASARWTWQLNQLRLAPQIADQPIRVCYAHYDFPKPPPPPQVVVSGGAVKYQQLHQVRPHAGLSCHILYIISSSHYPFDRLSTLVQQAQSKGIKVVWNQNGVYVNYAYHSKKVQKNNAILTALLHKADYVFYQSAFAQLASDHFLGPHQGSFEILHNAVDTRFYCPARNYNVDELTLLIAGSHNDAYRLTTAVQTLSIVTKQYPHARMIIAGKIPAAYYSEVQSLITTLRLEDHIEFINAYTQLAAPTIFGRAHILLHTQYNDVCPTVVLEAMACGLPIVYSQSGGTPELVGATAGYGVPTVLDWEQIHPPEPADLAMGVLTVTEKWSQYSEAARQRVEESFELTAWQQRHLEVFSMLMEM